MTTQSAKTPTPWHYIEGDEGFDIKTSHGVLIAYVGSNSIDKANAAHIVHCVNHFDEMREALEELSKWSCGANYFSALEKARAILEKVGKHA